jgi:uncharacterized protein YkwD
MIEWLYLEPMRRNGPRMKIIRAAYKTAIVLVLFTLSLPAFAMETGNLSALRAEALEEVNQVRRDHDLPPLEAAQALDDAAQAHAVDMIENDYYAHVAPDGTAPMDWFVDNGGSRWRVLRENIARCTNCPPDPTIQRVQSFQEGWMNSPEHRDNILARGLDSFGFGIAGEGDEVFAVQTFSGPGMPRGLQAGEEPTPLGQDEFGSRMAHAVNRARQQEGLDPLNASDALSEVAQQLLPDSAGSDALVGDHEPLFELLPQSDEPSFTSLQVLAGGCGGCGDEATRQDVRGFVDQWLDNPGYSATLLDSSMEAIGFAMRVDGRGRKVGIVVVGSR